MSVTIPNKQHSLHIRRSAKFVRQVERFETRLASRQLLSPLCLYHTRGTIESGRSHCFVCTYAQPPKNNSKDSSVCSVGWAMNGCGTRSGRATRGVVPGTPGTRQVGGWIGIDWVGGLRQRMYCTYLRGARSEKTMTGKGMLGKMGRQVARRE